MLGCNDNNNDWTFIDSVDPQEPSGDEQNPPTNSGVDDPTQSDQNSNGTGSSGVDVPDDDFVDDPGSNDLPIEEPDENGVSGSEPVIGTGDSELGNENGSTGESGTDNGVQPDDSDTVVSLEMPGLTNLYRVSEHLYRSAQPGVDGLVSAEALGIETVLSLQLLNMDSALSEASQVNLTYAHVPMIPSSVTQEDVLKALRVIRDSKGPVLVHCLHGSDRTGTVTAMYRVVFQNWTKEAAKAEMLEERFGYHEEFANLLTLIDSIDVEAFREALAL